MKKQEVPEVESTENLTDIAQSLRSIAECLEKINATLELFAKPKGVVGMSWNNMEQR